MRVRLKIRRLPVQPPPGLQHFFMEIDHEILSMVILSFGLFKKFSCQVLAKECALRGLSLPSKSVVR